MPEHKPPRNEQRLELADGRKLGMAEFGPEGGFPIFWFHGTPGARRQIPPAAVEHAEQVGVRIIALERPGVGWSTPHQYDHMADWAVDVEQVADQLGVDEFGVIGLSGGGPYVLAVAATLPERVVGAAVLGGVAPTTGDEAPPGGLVGMMRPVEPLLNLLREPIAFGLNVAVKGLTLVADPAFNLYMRFGPQSDREMLARPEMAAMFKDDILNAARHQFKALVYDAVLFTRHWGFDVADIEVPVFFWQGDADFFVPLKHGEVMADLVADSKFHFQPGAGHLATLDAASEAFDLILERRRAAHPESNTPL